MLEFELLRAFVAVAECGGFRRAAERLRLTQSTVSQQIKRLELEAGRPLLRRTTRMVALTDLGEMLLGDAAALAGLAIAPLPASALCAGLRVLGKEDGLPPLPDLEFAIFEKARPSPALAALAAALASLSPASTGP